MRSRRLLAAACIAAATALLVAGCSSSSTTSTPAATGAGKPDASATVNVGLVLEPTDLNIRTTSGIAIDQVLIDNVYQGLVGRTATNSIRNVLATTHTISPDGLTYTFTLHKGITFGDGTPMTTADVIWSLTQVKNNPTTYQNASDLAAVDTITSPATNTVVLHLTHPDSNLLFALTGRAGLILQQTATNPLATTANGTGPYLLTSWKQGDSLTLTRNPQYWGAKAKVKKVVFTYYTSPSAGINAMASGDLDVETAVDPTLQTQLKNVSGVSLKRGKTTDKYTLAFNNTDPALSTLKVRQALRAAIDNKAIITALGGAAVLQGGPIPALDPGYQNLTSTQTFNPTQAKKLLKQAGVSNLKLNLEYPNIYPAALGDILTTEFKTIGVTLTVKQVDFTTWLTDVFLGKGSTPYQLSIVDHAETHDFGNWANPNYYFHYDNKQVHNLYAQSQTATTPQAAATLLKKAAKIVASDSPADWLYTATTITALHTGITGFPTTSTSTRLNLATLAKR